MFLKTHQLKDDKAPALSEILSSVSIKIVDQIKKLEQFRSVDGYTICMRNADCVSDNIYCSLGIEQKDQWKSEEFLLWHYFLSIWCFLIVIRLFIFLCISAGHLGFLKDLYIFLACKTMVSWYGWKDIPSKITQLSIERPTRSKKTINKFNQNYFKRSLFDLLVTALKDWISVVREFWHVSWA